MKGRLPVTCRTSNWSEYDRLAIHILYPEDARVAELAGTRVLRQGETLHLRLELAVRGAVIAKVLKKIAWKLDGAVKSTAEALSLAMPASGKHTLSLTYTRLTGPAVLLQHDHRGAHAGRIPPSHLGAPGRTGCTAVAGLAPAADESPARADLGARDTRVLGQRPC
ncbi:MAG: hypothetical protein PHR30_07890 [Gallionellaceae bacterium]|nr:hypothetical protein [Gallionellaceae bacterium]